jgi:hypothetical protein
MMQLTPTYIVYYTHCTVPGTRTFRALKLTLVALVGASLRPTFFFRFLKSTAANRLFLCAALEALLGIVYLFEGVKGY